MKTANSLFRLVPAAALAALILPGLACAQTATAKTATQGNTVKQAREGQTVKPAYEGGVKTLTEGKAGKKDCSNDVKAKNFDPYCDLNRTMK